MYMYSVVTLRIHSNAMTTRYRTVFVCIMYVCVYQALVCMEYTVVTM